MSVLSWGKPKIEVGKLTETGNIEDVTEWILLPTGAEGTTQLNTATGDVTEAKEEGGALVDRKTAKSTYSLEVTCFVKKSEELPLADVDGIVEGEFVVRLQPQDKECKGILIKKAACSAETTFTSADGLRVKYTFSALQPTTGSQIERKIITLSSDGQ